MRKKELNLYLAFLENSHFTDRKRDIEYTIGMFYVKEKEYEKAIIYFKKAFMNYEENYYYNPDFSLIIESYLKCNKIEDAKKALAFFMRQKAFDKRFSKLEKRYSHILR
ncbi:hypothetical protein [Fredinandcohnia quinoae]|uniref:Tetratricopeptide repeat protein n=1 Tax=Fredinandcohnia quinoae TaxID=2918902 RepID=A0AAW5E4C3_9BACI|nr:hypothetical protein [Fredinandcohnia sp. SECRCQ15]MCH1626399.1 hypothetical protein [Fredinandcohnia sp. SECRCQ15]